MENKSVVQAMASAGAAAFGQMVKSLRQTRGWSQSDLAQWMANAGYPMHQTTVAKLENATRPTSIEEALALAAILRTDIATLLSTAGRQTLTGREAAELQGKLTDLEQRAAQLQRQYSEFQRERSQLRQAVIEAGGFDDGEHHEAT